VNETIRELIRLALAEDVGAGDITTNSTIPEGQRSTARVVVKAEGVFFDGGVTEAVLGELDASVSVEVLVGDGERVAPGTVAARVTGATRAILTGERLVLNFLQRLSGVATLTARYVAAVEGTGVALLDTRKTTPGMRTLEKAAVAAGGGSNHRQGLYDMALVKDNHIAAAGGIGRAVAAVRESAPDVAVEVEVTDLERLRQALEAGADRVMLDNMSLESMAEAIRVARAWEPAPEIEASGGVTLESIRRIADLGPDFISVGALTHSAPALDISLEFEEDV
jgi:nicotinate-nucleotide pyrophosphorylase (carboxylating)